MAHGEVMYLFAEEEYSVCVFLQKVKFINSYLYLLYRFMTVLRLLSLRFTKHNFKVLSFQIVKPSLQKAGK